MLCAVFTIHGKVAWWKESLAVEYRRVGGQSLPVQPNKKLKQSKTRQNRELFGLAGFTFKTLLSN